jgi:branched-chain amino acid aminotransferase
MEGRRLWRDGSLVAWNEATISVLAHPLQRGALVFDVVSFHDGRRGPAVFRLREHVARFLRSAEIVGYDIPFEAETLAAATREVVDGTGLREGLIRISGFVPTIEPDVVPRDDTASVVIAAYARGDFPRPNPAPRVYHVTIPRDVRRAGPEVFPPDAKVAAAYFGPMLARRRALEGDFDEVVLLDREGRVAEAPTANVFAMIDGVLTTPPLGRILPGITRDAVLAIARAEGIEVAEAPITPEAFAWAEEAFLTATSLPIAPIASVDRRPIADGEPGPITERLRARFARIVADEDPLSEAWLSPAR